MTLMLKRETGEFSKQQTVADINDVNDKKMSK